MDKKQENRNAWSVSFQKFYQIFDMSVISCKVVIVGAISKTRCINDREILANTHPFSFFSAGYFCSWVFSMGNIETFAFLILSSEDRDL